MTPCDAGRRVAPPGGSPTVIELIHELYSTDDFAQFARYQPGVKSADQLNSQLAGTTETALRIGASDNVELACEWAQTKETRLRQVHFMLKRAGTIAAGKTVRMRLEGDSSGLPDGKPTAWSKTVAADTMAAAFAYVKFEFADDVVLEAGKTYHLVLEGDYTASATNNVVWRSKTVASGGNQEVKDASWANVATEDLEVYAAVAVVVLSPEEAVTVVGLSEIENPELALEARTADVPGLTNDAKFTLDSTPHTVVGYGPDIEGHTIVMLSKD